MLIARWRQDFRDETLPFLLVQLPMHTYADTPENGAWSKLREAQMRVYQTVKNTGIAVILDCGEYCNIHPVDKHPVGHRLALQARRWSTAKRNCRRSVLSTAALRQRATPSPYSFPTPNRGWYGTANPWL